MRRPVRPPKAAVSEEEKQGLTQRAIKAALGLGWRQ
jgi:hypothetical protein